MPINEKEQPSKPGYLEVKINPRAGWGCIDGRKPDLSTPDPRLTVPTTELGPQMLGGELHPIVLKTIYDNIDLDEKSIEDDTAIFISEGLVPGTHHGSHKKELLSDCGFADRLREILQVALDKREEITQRLLEIDPELADSIQHAYEILSNFDLSHIHLVGEPLISETQTAGAINQNLLENHGESEAYANFKPGITFNRILANSNGHQAFNLDMPAVIESTHTLGLTDDSFIVGCSLILYQATEIVLVEQKDKPALKVQVHK